MKRHAIVLLAAFVLQTVFFATTTASPERAPRVEGAQSPRVTITLVRWPFT
jgi:hypothetical protein